MLDFIVHLWIFNMRQNWKSYTYASFKNLQLYRPKTAKDTKNSEGFELEIATSLILRNLGSSWVGSCPSLGPNSISFAYNETKLNNYVPFRLAKVEM